MSSVGWQPATLSSISTAIKDGSHGSHRRVAKGVPLLSAKNVAESGLLEWDDLDEQVSEEEYLAICRLFTPLENDLLLTIVGTLGRRALFNGARVAFQRSVAFVRVDSRKVNPRYSYHAVGTHDFRQQLVRRSNATAQAGLYLGALGQTTIPLPPLGQQSSIAAVLDAVDEAIATSQGIIAKCQQVRTGLLHDLLTHGIDENGELRDPLAHPKQFKDSPRGRIPKAWEVDSLVRRVRLPTGQVDPRMEPYTKWVLVAPDHIETGTGRLIGKKTAAEQGAISGKYVFEAGDVIYSKIRPYLRKAILADFPGLCSADMYPLRPTHETDSRFLLAVVLGEDFSRFASAVSMRSGFPKINRTELAEYRVAWPTLDEQRRIGSVLAVADSQQLSCEAELSKLEQVKAGLTVDLLTGRVRVPEDLKIEASS